MSTSPLPDDAVNLAAPSASQARSKDADSMSAQYDVRPESAQPVQDHTATTGDDQLPATEPASPQSLETPDELRTSDEVSDDSDDTFTVEAHDVSLSIGHGNELAIDDFSLASGQLGVVLWPHGDERQAALLALAGRFPRSSGDLSLSGTPVRRRGRVTRTTAIAYFAGIDELDSRLTVGEHLHERASLVTPLWRRTPRLEDPQICDPARIMFATDDIPWKTRALDLTAIDSFALRITTALIVQPEVLVVDDLDALRTVEDAEHGWRALQALCDRGITVIAGTSARTFVPPSAVTIPLHEA